MSYDYDESTVGQGIIAWLLFNLGIIPFIIYLIVSAVRSGRGYSASTGLFGKRSGITFAVLLLIEIVVIIIIVAASVR